MENQKGEPRRGNSGGNPRQETENTKWEIKGDPKRDPTRTSKKETTGGTKGGNQTKRPKGKKTTCYNIVLLRNFTKKTRGLTEGLKKIE